MAISKKIRFEVFKRDGFQCAYCGRTPPDILLEVDHINPKSKGGEDDINNFLTACFDCNRGKMAIPLSRIPAKLSENLDILQEKETQLAEYNKIVSKIERRLKKSATKIEQEFQIYYPHNEFTNQFKQSIIRFLKQLPENQVSESMQIACSKFKSQNVNKAIKYFCGICWHKIKGI